ncbi:MAG: NAD-dependent deacetylase [Vicinamibacterales bacterium]
MTADADGSTLERLVDAVASARRLVVLTGAGVSAASGVPTFRGADGLWRRHRPEDLATPDAFARDPRLVWEWYDWRRQVIAACAPNPAHDVLARWTRHRPGTTLVTQNVDGLHERAGATGVVALHGSIWEVRCAAGCAAAGPGRHDVTAPWPDLPPRCRHCDGPERPGVVWYGEALDVRRLGHAVAAARAADVFLAVGTSAVVYPAAGLVLEARRAGAMIIEINPDDTPMAPFLDLAIRAPAERLLPAIDRGLDPGAAGGR